MSTSPTFQPTRSSTLRVAGTGPMPITSGCTPALAPRHVRGRGARAPASRSASSLTSSRPAAPSLSGEELPAVTVPPARNTGLSAAQLLQRVSARMPSSASTARRRRATGRSSAAKSPRRGRAAARWWLRSANASCRSRSMPYRAGDLLGRLPHRAARRAGRASRGLISRQPSRVSNSSIAPGQAPPRVGAARTAPGSSTRSRRRARCRPRPRAIARAAVVTASRPGGAQPVDAWRRAR